MFIDLLLLTYEYVPFNSFLLIYFHTSFFHNAILCSQRIPPGTLFLFYCSFTPIVPPLALRGFSLHNYRTNPLFHRYRPLHTLLQLLNIANFIQFCYLILKKRIIFLIRLFCQYFVPDYFNPINFIPPLYSCLHQRNRMI